MVEWRSRKSTIMVNAMTLVVIGVALAPVGSWLFPGEEIPSMVAREATCWGLTALIIAYIIFVERRPLASIGLSAPRWSGLAFGLAGTVVMIGGMAAIYMVLFPALGLSDADETAAVVSTPVWFRIALVLRAAVFEEILFRGFMIERLTEVTGLRSLAATLAVAAFTWAHLSGWGWAHWIVAGYGGLILTALYLWLRDLVANMIAHLGTDVVGLLLLPE